MLALRGEPRAFSEQRPLTGEEPPLIWEDLWRDWAGAAFFQHLIDDLTSVSPKVFIDCNGEIDLPAAERMAALVDLVLLVVDYNSEGAKSRAYHYGRQIRENDPDRGLEILAVPVAVRGDGHPDLLAEVRYELDRFEATGRLIVPIVLENNSGAAELLGRYHAIQWDTITQTLDDLDILMPLVYGGLAT